MLHHLFKKIKPIMTKLQFAILQSYGIIRYAEREGERMLDVVSLFAGIGGICLGFRQAGFNICWANEKDHAACLTYRHNLGDDYLIEGDIKKIDEGSIPGADILAAGFPCE